jgi:hypothetical protein
MRKILLGALLLLSIVSYSQDDSFIDKIGNGHGNNGHDNDNHHDDDNDDDDNDDDDDDDYPAAPIIDYLYILAIAGVVYANKKLN